MPIKPLLFKGDKKPKKRKHREHEGSGQANIDENGVLVPAEEDDSWTSPDAATDVSGPCLIVLSTSPPTCLAADAHGNVFASQIENMVENNAASAEPHDVRQVWVASRVVDSESISFKASHGGYLSCDGYGILGAKREARGVEEGFVLESVEEDGEQTDWRLRTTATKVKEGEKGSCYLCAVTETSAGDPDSGKKKVAISLRGDGEAGSESIRILIRMQARFKSRLQQNKEQKAKEKVSRQEVEAAVGRKLDDDEVKRLKRARKEGTYHEEVLNVRAKGKHDKFA